MNTTLLYLPNRYNVQYPRSGDRAVYVKLFFDFFDGVNVDDENIYQIKMVF